MTHHDPDHPLLAAARRSGLSSRLPEGWIDQSADGSFRDSLGILGGRILMTRPRGHATEQGIHLLVTQIQDLLGSELEGAAPIFWIADYSDLKGVDRSGRLRFIQWIKEVTRLHTVVFVGLSPLIRLHLKLGMRMNPLKFQIRTAADFDQGLRIVREICRGEGVELEPAEPDRSEQAELPARRTLELEGVSVGLELRPGGIMLSWAIGGLEEQHVAPIAQVRHELLDRYLAPGEPFSFIIDVQGLGRSSARARRKYSESLRRTHDRNPLRLIVFHGANPLIRAAIHLTRPFLPVPIRLATNLEQALALEARHRGRVSSLGDAPEEEPTHPPDQIGQIRRKLLRYLGSLDWEATGAPPIEEISRDHPLQAVFEGIALIKAEFDDVFREKQQIEVELREQNRFIQAIADHLPVGVSVHRATDGHCLYQNRRFEEITGYDRETLVDMQAFFEHLFPDPEHRREIQKRYQVEASSGDHRQVLWERLPLTRRSGEKLFVTIRSVPLPARDLMITTVQDVTERMRSEEDQQRLQEQLGRARKMEAVGLLAGGVAHDLNNILSGIVSYPELLLLDQNLDEETRRALQVIQQSGQRAAAVVQDLLTLVRGVASPRQPVDLNRLVQDFLGSPEMRQLEGLHPKVRLAPQLDEDLLPVQGSPIHLRKVVMNLVLNSAEAIGQAEGTIRLSTENQYLDRPLSGYEDVRTGEYALLSVLDDGPGIEPGDLDRIFEPFYSKKVMGRSGSGLGLAVVWNTVQDHRGYMDVRSGAEGTRFDLYFPLAREAIPTHEDPRQPEEIRGSGELVLVVDDVESQREIACRLLTGLGYCCQAVASGREAVGLLQDQRVDALLLDMIMEPGWNGRETYEHLLEIQPDLPAVIASGFSPTEEVHRTQELGAGPYLKKPYSMESLGQALRQVLLR